MIKYTFLLYSEEQQRFLEHLSELGVVDVSISNWQPNATERAKLNYISTATATIEKLNNFVFSIKEKNEEKEPIPYSTAQEAIDVYTENSATIERLKVAIAKVEKERDDSAEWGDFDLSTLNALEAEGVRLSFFVTSKKQYKEEWQQEHTLYTVAENGSHIRFIAITNASEDVPLMDGATLLRRPSQTAKEYQKQIDNLEQEAKECKEALLRAAATVPLISERKEQMAYSLSGDKIISTSKNAAECTISIIEGWVPEPKEADIDTYFANVDGVIMVKDKPTLEDNPPVLLKNNRFARMCEMIGNLYSLPSYHELDLTPFFAPFFIFFVGICFGDLGYGLIVFVGAIIASFILKGDFVKRVVDLVIWCALAAMIMGSITGTFFGIELSSFKVFSQVKFMGQMDMFTFALVVGLIQLVYAMFVRVYARTKYMGFKYAISTLAWALVILTSAAAYLLPEMGIPFGFDGIAYKIIIGLLLAINVLYINPDKKNLLFNLGGGLWELYNSVTGLLGDTLSYIRLFALGLSSGIIASVFNDLAVGMSGDVPVLKYVIMVLILLIGHAINIFMSAISSFVHPLRLTFVEFYKNAGFEGGGREYTPYKAKDK